MRVSNWLREQIAPALAFEDKVKWLVLFVKNVDQFTMRLADLTTRVGQLETRATLQQAAIEKLGAEYYLSPDGYKRVP